MEHLPRPLLPPPPYPRLPLSPAPAAPPTDGRSTGERPRLSPVVQKLAAEHNVSLDEAVRIPGTGVGGRVTKQDILRYIETRGATPAPAASAPAPAPAPEFEPGADEKVVPLTAGAPSDCGEHDARAGDPRGLGSDRSGRDRTRSGQGAHEGGVPPERGREPHLPAPSFFRPSPRPSRRTRWSTPAGAATTCGCCVG